MMITRRRFIQYAAAAAVAGGSLPAPRAADAAPPGREDAATQAGMDPREHRLLRCAAQAPSGHNMQPWRVTRHGAFNYTIGLDPARLLPSVDPANRESILSIGAFTQLLAETAHALGLETTITAGAPGAGNRGIVRLRCVPGTAGPDRTALIDGRRTVRQGQLNRELDRNDVSALAALWPGHIHYFPRMSKHGACLREWAFESYRAQANRRDAQQELVRCTRFSAADIARHRDGLTAAGMEFGAFTAWFARSFMKPADMITPANIARGIDRCAAQVKEGAGWIIMTGGASPAELIEAGRRFARLGLAAFERRIAIHPMTQILEEAEWRSKFAAEHRGTIIPQFVLRVGYVKEYPAPVSPRRPVASFVVTA